MLFVVNSVTTGPLMATIMLIWPSVKMSFDTPGLDYRVTARRGGLAARRLRTTALPHSCFNIVQLKVRNNNPITIPCNWQIKS